MKLINKGIIILRTLTYIGLLAATLTMMSCGGNTSEQSSDVAPKSMVDNEASKPAADGTIELTINGDDLMKFDKKELRATAGSKVKITLNHTGKMAKTAMGHNLVILKEGTDVAAFALEAIKAMANDYIPESNEIIAHTGLIGGGESTSVTFDAPEKGEYVFICSFPGHYALMQGKFIVE